jgi:threonine dehydratase
VPVDQAASLVMSLAAGTPVTNSPGSTIADGIAVERPGDLPFAIIQRYVDDVVTVAEADIRGGIPALLGRTKLLAERAGAAPLGAILYGRIHLSGQSRAPARGPR